MKIQINSEELFIITIALEAYWVSLIIFQKIILPVILGMMLLSIIVYHLVKKYFGVGLEKQKCRMLSKPKEIFLTLFFFGSRLAFAIISLWLNVNIAFILSGLIGLSLLDTSLSKMWCLNTIFRVYEESLNVIVAQLWFIINNPHGMFGLF